MSTNPEGTKPCTRCKGTGTFNRAFRGAIVSESCARCGGFGFCLLGDKLAAHCEAKARAHMADIANRGMLKVDLLTRYDDSKLGRYGRAATTARLDELRGEWVAVRARARAYKTLAGTAPTLKAVAAVAGDVYGAGHR